MLSGSLAASTESSSSFSVFSSAVGEIPVDRELLADPLRCDVCPGQGPVGVPDLDAQDVRALGQVAEDN
jgi:hypothetical protein